MHPAVRVSARLVAVSLALCAMSACSGSGVGHAPPKADLTLHTLPVCKASAEVPPDVSTVTPSAASPPTSVLRVGQAVAFTVPAGGEVHAAGSTDRAIARVVCQSARGSGSARQAVILGLAPGFIRVALTVPGSAKLRQTLLTVTG